ncbi:MAG: hypothetical protein JWN30_2516 [Bacilli bacterium]|nr:hypothetical protein [Bacilli bacterium]
MFKQILAVAWSLAIGLVLTACSTSPSHYPKNTAQQVTSSISPMPIEEAKVQGTSQSQILTSIDFLKSQTGWVSTMNNQLLKTRDGGRSWAHVAIPDAPIQKLDFVNEQTGWAVVVQFPPNGSQDTTFEILHTIDGGSDWTTQWTHNGPTNWNGQIQLYFSNNQHGYALIENQLLSTSDGGDHWNTLSVKDGFQVASISFISQSAGWIAGYEPNDSGNPNNPNSDLEVFQTIDSGQHWDNSMGSISIAGTQHWMGISFSDASNGWLFDKDSSDLAGKLFHTTDGGMSWSQIQDSLFSGRIYPSRVEFSNANDGYITFDSGASPLAGGVAVTHDGGSSFVLIGKDQAWSMKDLAVLSKAEAWAINDVSASLLHTTDGGTTWTQVYPALEPTRGLTFLTDEIGFGIGTRENANAIVQTNDGGVHWQEVSVLPVGKEVQALSFTDQLHGDAAVVDQNSSTEILYQTNDGGHSWTQISQNVLPASTDPKSNNQGGLFDHTELRFFDQSHAIMTVKTFPAVELLNTADGGRSWSLVQETQIKPGSWWQINFSSADHGWMLTTSDTNVSLQSLDKTGAWQLVWSGPGWGSGLVFSSSQVGWMLLDTNPLKEPQFVLLNTTDGGKNWSETDFPQSFHLNFIPGTDGIKMAAAGKTLWILSVDGLLKSTDGGLTWVYQ